MGMPPPPCDVVASWARVGSILVCDGDSQDAGGESGKLVLSCHSDSAPATQFFSESLCWGAGGDSGTWAPLASSNGGATATAGGAGCNPKGVGPAGQWLDKLLKEGPQDVDAVPPTQPYRELFPFEPQPLCETVPYDKTEIVAMPGCEAIAHDDKNESVGMPGCEWKHQIVETQPPESVQPLETFHYEGQHEIVCETLAHEPKGDTQFYAGSVLSVEEVQTTQDYPSGFFFGKPVHFVPDEDEVLTKVVPVSSLVPFAAVGIAADISIKQKSSFFLGAAPKWQPRPASTITPSRQSAMEEVPTRMLPPRAAMRSPRAVAHQSKEEMPRRRRLRVKQAAPHIPASKGYRAREGVRRSPMHAKR